MDDPTATVENLYHKYGLSIRAFLRRRCRDGDLADELLQETFLIAIRDIEALSYADSKRAWLIGIARNLFREHVRKQARRRTVTLSEEPGMFDGKQVDPRSIEMRRAIARLPETQREVIELRLNEDLNYAEIAEALGLRISTVRSRMHQAILYLRAWAVDINRNSMTKTSKATSLRKG